MIKICYLIEKISVNHFSKYGVLIKRFKLSKNGHDHKAYLLFIMDDLVFVVLKKVGVGVNCQRKCLLQVSF